MNNFHIFHGVPFNFSTIYELISKAMNFISEREICIADNRIQQSCELAVSIHFVAAQRNKDLIRTAKVEKCKNTTKVEKI